MRSIKKIKRSNIIKLEEDFALLENFEEDGIATYQFNIKLDRLTALKDSAVSVRIKIRSEKTKKQPGIFEESDLQLGFSTKPKRPEVLDNILKFQGLQADVKNENQESVIREYVVDLTTTISNDILTTRPDKVFGPSDFPDEGSFELETVDSIKDSNEKKPILQFSNFRYQLKKKKTQELNVFSIIRDKKDPSTAIQRKYITSTKKAFAGLARPVRVKPFRPLVIEPVFSDIIISSPIRNTDDFLKEIVVPVRRVRKNVFSVVKKTIVIDTKKLNSDNYFYATFELIGKNGLVVEKIERKVPHGKNIKVLNTPVFPPVVNATATQFVGRNVLEIRQVDSNADKIRMFRKVLYPTKRLEDLSYDFVQDITLEKIDSVKKIVDLTNNVNNIIYRFISISPEDQVSADFTNIVVTGKPTKGFRKSENLIYAAIFATIGEEGIDVEVSNISPGPIAIRVLKKDLTIKQKDFEVIPHLATEQQVYLLRGESSPGTFTDKNVKSGHVYEYCCKLIFEDGTEEVATGCDTIEFRPLSEGVVDISVSEPSIVEREDSLDIAFRVSTNLQDGDIDFLKSLIDKQGFSELFAEELKDDKDSLKKLIAHSIRRINLTTGESEYFKTFTGTFFSDLDNRKLSSVSELEGGHRYRYVVTPLFREPTSLFQTTKTTQKIRTITTTMTGEFEGDPDIVTVTEVSASFLPLKFKHPITFEKGNIVTLASLKTHHAKDSFEFGSLGASKSVEITLLDVKPRVTNAKAIKFNKNTNLIRWQIVGPKDKIDHFIIIMNRMGQEEVIGKSHAIFDGDFIEYIDKITCDEIGQIFYRVIPVYTDYEHGSAVFTNRINI